MIFWRTISDISLALYFFTDHPLYFNSIGFVKQTKEWIDQLDYINNVFWLLNSLFDIAITLVEMKHVQAEIKELVSLIPRLLSNMCAENEAQVRQQSGRREAGSRRRPQGEESRVHQALP
jgi:hypothetical protein